MLVLSTKPLQKLTGTDRQADRQTGGRAGKPVYWEAAPPKTLILQSSLVVHCQLFVQNPLRVKSAKEKGKLNPKINKKN